MDTSNFADDLAHESDLLRSVVYRQQEQTQSLLDSPLLTLAALNWRDFDGWTPLLYASSRGDLPLIQQLLRKGASVNMASISKEGSTGDGTTPLHVCAAGKSSETGSDDFLSSAAALMAAGGNPYQENSSGQTAINIAASRKNTEMKMLLESCGLFKGSLGFRTPRFFGDRLAERFCYLQPRFAWMPEAIDGQTMLDGEPDFELVCYKTANDLRPWLTIPLPSNSNARLHVKGKGNEGVMYAKLQPKDLKGLVVKTKAQQCMLSVKSKASAVQSSHETLQTLSVVLSCILYGRGAGALGRICNEGYGASLQALNLAIGLVALTQETANPGSGNAAEESNGTVEESVKEPKNRRKSLSIANWGKAAMRRMSLEKPRRNSMTLDRGGKPSREATPRTFKRPDKHQDRISEEGPEPEDTEPSYPKPDAPSEKSPWKGFAQRLSMQVDRKSFALKRNRHTTLQQQSDFVYSLTDRLGTDLAFWNNFKSALDQALVNRRRPLGLDTGTESRRMSLSSQNPYNDLAYFNPRASVDLGQTLSTQPDSKQSFDMRRFVNQNSLVNQSHLLVNQSPEPTEINLRQIRNKADANDDGLTYKEWAAHLPEPVAHAITGQPSQAANPAFSTTKEAAALNKEAVALNQAEELDREPERQASASSLDVEEMEGLTPISKTSDAAYLDDSIIKAATSEQEESNTARSASEAGLPPQTPSQSTPDTPHMQQPEAGDQSNPPSPYARYDEPGFADSDPSKDENQQPNAPPKAAVDMDETVHAMNAYPKGAPGGGKDESSSKNESPSKGPGAVTGKPKPELLERLELSDAEIAQAQSALHLPKAKSQKSSKKAPKPMAHEKFSNDVMFGSEISGPEDLFNWSLRPMSNREKLVAKAQAQSAKPDKVASWLAEATTYLKEEKEMTDAAEQVLNAPPPGKKVQAHGGENPANDVPQKMLRQPSGEALPHVMETVKPEDAEAARKNKLEAMGAKKDAGPVKSETSVVTANAEDVLRRIALRHARRQEGPSPKKTSDKEPIASQ